MLAKADPGRPRRFDRLIIHIREVHDETHTESAPFEVSVDKIVEQERAEIADVRRTVQGGPTPVDPDPSGVHRYKGFDLPGERVEETKAHRIQRISRISSTRQSPPFRTSPRNRVRRT